MRWIKKRKPTLKPYQSRIICRFLFFPKTLHKETRWLEVVYIYQQSLSYSSYDKVGWFDMDWTTKEHKERMNNG